VTRLVIQSENDKVLTNLEDAQDKMNAALLQAKQVYEAKLQSEARMDQRIRIER